ncbi:hypothetical protein MKA31_10795 [[Clostridium] innocuum]|uniref:hypothetical protein n=1 Tax=Clostridium innocuum TaxID=1522 RepID=UPI002147C9EC|nr:hypothetical protein [[Clostridium] innocuum]MCR0160721.1 hypothetical protein [[Clostridium] innocuum]MCR0272575.1 hypothetical protein [[Clostridium] innocuum]
MENEWEEIFDKELLPALDAVTNALYREAKIKGILNQEYFEHCMCSIKEKALAYVEGKQNALTNIESNIK